jgi:hypothetical protein
MKHLLMDPAFPDKVGQWAEEKERADAERDERARGGDKRGGDLGQSVAHARPDIAATRLW